MWGGFRVGRAQEKKDKNVKNVKKTNGGGIGRGDKDRPKPRDRRRFSEHMSK